MWTLKKPKFWSSRRKRCNCSERELPHRVHHHSCQCCHCPPCSIPSPHCNQSSMASQYEPNAPPLPPGAEFSEEWRGVPSQHEHQPLIHGQGYGVETGSGSDYGSFQGPMPYGQTPSYQQYMVPSPAYGVPVWQDTRHEWSTGLCHCGADVPICLLGCFCPCILFGKIAEKLDNGMTSCLTASVVWYLLQQFVACGCIYSCGYRRKLRAKYNLPETPCPDCLVHCLCWPCAFCQEYRELDVRRIREEAWAGRPIVAPPQQQSMSY